MIKYFSGRTGLLTLTTASMLAVSACSTPPVQVGPAVSTPVVEYGQSDYSNSDAESYTLSPSDIIAINVYREPELSLESVPVGADGMVSLPFIGAIKADGLTTPELERIVAQKLAGTVLIDPKVSVNVLQFASHVVTVEGSVEKPGMYPFKPGTRLSGAMSLASGPSRVAKLAEVAVFRKTATGMQIAKFDYGAVRAGTMMDPILRPNDRIVVGTSGLSQFWQDALKALPAFALFTNF